jgi:hypothetical protein
MKVANEVQRATIAKNLARQLLEIDDEPTAATVTYCISFKSSLSRADDIRRGDAE